MAIAELLVGQPKVEMTEDERKAFNRRQLVSALRRNDFGKAADVVEHLELSTSAIEDQKVLAAALTAGGAERWDRAGWAIFHLLDAKAGVEQEAIHHEEEGKVLFFLKWLIPAFISVVHSPKVSKDDLNSATMALERSKPSNQWGEWALRAVFRLITAKTANAVNALFDKDKTLGEKCPNAASFVDHLREQIRVNVPLRTEAINKAKAQAEVDRRARQLERSAASRGMKGSNSKAELIGKGKKSKRALNDPHRHGK